MNRIQLLRRTGLAAVFSLSALGCERKRESGIEPGPLPAAAVPTVPAEPPAVIPAAPAPTPPSTGENVAKVARKEPRVAPVSADSPKTSAVVAQPAVTPTKPAITATKPAVVATKPVAAAKPATTDAGSSAARVPVEAKTVEPVNAPTANVIFKTTPPGATVKLLARNGDIVAQGRTPTTFSVKGGSYAWQVELAGYVTDKSGNERLDVSPQDADTTITVALAQAGNRGQALQLANDAFLAGRCTEAVRLYESVPRPADLNGEVGNEWVGNQLKVAECSIREKEFNRAFEALSEVKIARPREWRARYIEGQAYCKWGRYEEGIRRLSELAGSYSGTLPTDSRQAAVLLSGYATAECNRLDYDNARQPDRAKDLLERTLSDYGEFIQGAELLKAKGGFPPRLEKELSDALKSAVDRYNKLNARK